MREREGYRVVAITKLPADGRSDEAFASKSPPIGGLRYYAAGRLAHRKGADLSDAPAFPGGAPLDVIGRILAERMTKSLSQPIIIENISGADGNIGTGRAVRATPDGYTVILGSNGTHVLNGQLYSLPYHVLNDFAPIALLAMAPYILFARNTIQANDLNDLIGWLRVDSTKASTAVASTSGRLIAAFFQKETRTQFTIVPYRSLPAAIQDLAAGQIDLLFGTPDQLPLKRAGNIKAYAMTSNVRLAGAPEIPTFSEIGLPSLSFSSWAALFAPRSTPKDVIVKLNPATVEAMADPAVRSRLIDLGFQIFPREQETPEALGAFVKAYTDNWWPIIKEFGIKAE